MIPWQYLDSAQVPESGEELCLYARAGEFSIRVGGFELMNSRVHGSEEALAELACAAVADHPDLRILIGGLGMGYTTAAALRRIGTAARIVVAEVAPAVVRWNHGPLGALAGHPLQDGRVTVREMDIARILQEGEHAYDAILLDVDNGPEALTRKGNGWLYERAGLDAAFRALRPGGVLAVWSAGPHHAFATRLSLAGFTVKEDCVRARPRRGARHTIWLARRGA